MGSIRSGRTSISYAIAACCCILSCSTDREAPCAAGGTPEGEICREYRYEEDDYIGYVEYRYAGGMLAEKTFYTRRGDVSSYVRIEQDAQGLFRKESVFRAENDFLTECSAYQYDASGRLIRTSVTDPDGIRYTEYAYDTTGRLSASVFYVNAMVTSYTNYLYNSNDNLYKTMTYAVADSSLLSHSRYSYFDSAVRKDFYDSGHLFDGHEVTLYRGGAVVQHGKYDKTGGVVREDHYEYDGAGRLKAHTYTEGPAHRAGRALYLYR